MHTTMTTTALRVKLHTLHVLKKATFRRTQLSVPLLIRVTSPTRFPLILRVIQRPCYGNWNMSCSCSLVPPSATIEIPPNPLPLADALLHPRYPFKLTSLNV